jgi:3-oxosteroid 1-dehydrogenase
MASPLAQPPFHAVKTVPGDLGTKGGLRTGARVPAPRPAPRARGRVLGGRVTELSVAPTKAASIGVPRPRALRRQYAADVCLSRG